MRSPATPSGRAEISPLVPPAGIDASADILRTAEPPVYRILFYKIIP